MFNLTENTAYDEELAFELALATEMLFATNSHSVRLDDAPRCTNVIAALLTTRELPAVAATLLVALARMLAVSAPTDPNTTIGAVACLLARQALEECWGIHDDETAEIARIMMLVVASDGQIDQASVDTLLAVKSPGARIAITMTQLTMGISTLLSHQLDDYKGPAGPLRHLMGIPEHFDDETLGAFAQHLIDSDDE
jgi:hypothetical protein